MPGQPPFFAILIKQTIRMSNPTRNNILSLLELKVSPVMLTVILALLMWPVAAHTPGFPMTPEWRLVSLIVLVAGGAVIALAGVWSFRKARTTVNPWRPHASSALVISGIYTRTRNPMYLGLLLALLGWGLYLANPFSLLVAVAFVPYMNRFQIRPEERALKQAYGDDFSQYCRRVRRWL
jgi:protein-S-isoprenylcysteine O-methyltransferase Ste14